METPQDPHASLLAWATSRGLTLNGIAPETLPGRGTGLVATRPLSAGETVLSTPSKLLRTLDTVPASIRRALPHDMSVHGLLAADLAIEMAGLAKNHGGGSQDEKGCAPWTVMMPKPKDFVTVPLNWPEELQELLPTRAKELLKKQKRKFETDWKAVSGASSRSCSPKNPGSPEIDGSHLSPGSTSAALRALSKTEYRHAWLLVNTRTFYFVTPSTAARGNRDDHMALQPVADLFNHTDLQGEKVSSLPSSPSTVNSAQDILGESKRGCHVSYDDEGFTITTSRAYEKGEEVHICYGQHCNDFLFVEYGFILDFNRWDEARLDEIILPLLEAGWDRNMGERRHADENRDKDKGNKKKRKRLSGEGNDPHNGKTKQPQVEDNETLARAQALKEKGFLGNYILDTETACYRTEVAIRALCMEEEAWRRFVDQGVEGPDGRYDEMLEDILEAFEELVHERVEKVQQLSSRIYEVTEAQEMLLRRWRQILKLVHRSIDYQDG